MVYRKMTYELTDNIAEEDRGKEKDIEKQR
jgi:hypothetical protein